MAKARTLCRRFSEPAERVIATVPARVIDEIDTLISVRTGNHPARGCRSEFVRQAIAEKLERDKANPQEAARNHHLVHRLGR
jgi:metal-responsive CopG/Arc/MetJ family transcriptional regulator